MAQHNAFYAQSGGVTAVINASACGVIETCRRHSDRIGKVYAGHNGIIGALTEDLIARVHANWKQPLSDELWAIHYNLACCLARSNNINGAFQALEKSLRAPTIQLSMVLVDGDLKSLRQDPIWPTWLAQQQKKTELPTPVKEQQEKR